MKDAGTWLSLLNIGSILLLKEDDYEKYDKNIANPHRICIENNGNATFLNLDAANEFKNMSIDIGAFECSLPSIKH